MKKSKGSDKTAEIAAPVREFLRQMLKKQISTMKEREKLAEYLGQSPSSISNLLKGEGSLDTWIAVICYYYKVDATKLISAIQTFDTLLRKHQPTESDKIAAQIKLPEAQRKILFSAILTAVTLNQED